MIGPGSLCFRVRGQLELGIRDEKDLLQELVEPLAVLRGNVRILRRAAPFLRLELLLDELLPNAGGIRAFRVDLVDGDHDRHLGRARVADRLERLRLDTVVRRDDEDGDVRHLRAACAKGGERLVARRVQKGDSPVVVIDLVGADVLRDAAGLGLDDRRLPDGVQKRRLAVVDVAHDRHDRGPRAQILFAVLVDLGLELFLVRMLDLDLALQLGRDQLDRVVRRATG